MKTYTQTRLLAIAITFVAGLAGNSARADEHWDGDGKAEYDQRYGGSSMENSASGEEWIEDDNEDAGADTDVEAGEPSSSEEMTDSESDFYGDDAPSPRPFGGNARQ